MWTLPGTGALWARVLRECHSLFPGLNATQLWLEASWRQGEGFSSASLELSNTAAASSWQGGEVLWGPGRHSGHRLARLSWWQALLQPSDLYL